MALFKKPKKNTPDPVVYVAKHNYEGKKGDLTFAKGDLLDVLKTKGDWWTAVHIATGQRGKVPSNFVKKYDPVTEEPHKASSLLAPKKFVALYDYSVIKMGDLSFSKGETMEVLDSRRDGWSWARLTRDEVVSEGFVPSNYIEELVDISKQPWYFECVSRERAERLLANPSNSEGSFLIRNSEKSRYSLSVLHGGVSHYKVFVDKSEGREKYFLTSAQRFGTLRELVEHYCNNDGLCTRLKSPCKRDEGAPVQRREETVVNKWPEWEIDRETITLSRKLGSGQFGEVWQGRWNNVDVAVKSIKPGSMGEEVFLREADVMRELRHPQLVELYGVCRQQPVWLVMELVTHGALLDYLRQKKSVGRLDPPHDLTSMAAQVASGMTYLERHKFVHRDLAARNVLKGKGVTVKIADFGLARVVQEDVYKATAATKVPIRWTAPEAIEHGLYTSKSDVWSYGVLLYEIITHGDLPYLGKENQEVAWLVRQGYRMPRPEQCPHGLYTIMFRCWMEKPEARPRFCDLEEEMQALLENT